MRKTLCDMCGEETINRKSLTMVDADIDGNPIKMAYDICDNCIGRIESFMIMNNEWKKLKGQAPATEQGVKQKDIAAIMNAINGALIDNGMHYVAAGYVNTEQWLSVMIEKE